VVLKVGPARRWRATPPTIWRLTRARRRVAGVVADHVGAVHAGQQRGGSRGPDAATLSVSSPVRAGVLQQRGRHLVVARYDQVFPARADTLSHVRRRVRELLVGPPAVAVAIAADIQLAVTEALANVVVHAYRDRDDGPVAFDATRANGRLVVSVRDFGCGLLPRADSPGLGMGISLMSALSETLVFERCETGTHVTMTFALDPPST
jgi:serine/threonine-protein kinase RsbW/stage II sporulation protein AB (anti-sigma F factor)